MQCPVPCLKVTEKAPEFLDGWKICFLLGWLPSRCQDVPSVIFFGGVLDRCDLRYAAVFFLWIASWVPGFRKNWVFLVAKGA